MNKIINFIVLSQKFASRMLLVLLVSAACTHQVVAGESDHVSENNGNLTLDGKTFESLLESDVSALTDVEKQAYDEWKRAQIHAEPRQDIEQEKANTMESMSSDFSF